MLALVGTRHIVHVSRIRVKRVRVVAKSAYGLCHTCLSVRPQRRERLSHLGFPWSLIFETFIKICQIPNLVKIGQKISCHPALRPKHILLLLVKYIRHKSIFVQHFVPSYCWKRHLSKQYTQKAFLPFHCNSGCASTQQSYVIRTLSVCFKAISGSGWKRTLSGFIRIAVLWNAMYLFGYRCFGQHNGPILKCQADKEEFFLECLTVGMGLLHSWIWPWNVSKHL